METPKEFSSLTSAREIEMDQMGAGQAGMSHIVTLEKKMVLKMDQMLI